MKPQPPKPGTQNAAILDYLLTNGQIDPISSLSKLGIYRLAARIQELRRAGHQIEMLFTRKHGPTTIYFMEPRPTAPVADLAAHRSFFQP